MKRGALTYPTLLGGAASGGGSQAPGSTRQRLGAEGSDVEVEGAISDRASARKVSLPSCRRTSGGRTSGACAPSLSRRRNWRGKRRGRHGRQSLRRRPPRPCTAQRLGPAPAAAASRTSSLLATRGGSWAQLRTRGEGPQVWKLMWGLMPFGCWSDACTNSLPSLPTLVQRAPRRSH